MLARVAQLKPASVLEIGVGTGLTLGRYPKSSSVTGIDLCPDMLSRARSRVASLRERQINLEAMDAETLSLQDSSFDCVTAPYVLSVTPNPELAIAEMRRVCKPGGVILILNHFSGSPFWGVLERLVEPLAARIGFRSDFEFDTQVGRHGLDIRAVTSVNLFGLSKLVEIHNS